MDRILDKLGANWKTVTGGVALILLGVGGLALRLVDPQHPAAPDADTSLGLIAAGLAAIGVAHKLRRLHAQAERSQQFVESQFADKQPGGPY